MIIIVVYNQFSFNLSNVSLQKSLKISHYEVIKYHVKQVIISNKNIYIKTKTLLMGYKNSKSILILH